MFVEDNPEASIDDILQHYGVMGMKWGKHRAKANSIDIKAARNRVQTQHHKLTDAHAKAQHIKDPVKRAEAMKGVAELKTSFLKNPDRVVAARLTRGEKIATALLLTPAGAGAVIGATSAVSRRIERKQELNKYTKK